jgi:NADH-quinone oxidoreductase subunit E
MVLQDVQEECRYLPSEVLIRIAKELGIPQARIFGVATFFKAFRLTPRGRKVLQVCTGTACHVRGSKLLLEKFERDIGIKSGETSGDLEYTLEGVNCVGACALGPVVVLNEQMLGHFTLGKVDKLLERSEK